MKNLIFLKINNLLHSFYFFDGFLHWAIQRVAAISIIFFTFSLAFLKTFWFFLLLVLFLFYHIFAGIRTLLDDYIHDLNLYLISNLYLRVTIIYFLKTIFIVFLC